jgi:hypothetical protein
MRRRTLAVLASLALTVATWTVASPAAVAENRVTPGNFTGFGFDQCETQSQRKMDRWLTHSPFFAVAVYFSGASRACRDQPNLTRKWISTQLSRGWRVLPIALGPQAGCHPKYPRHGDDPKIDQSPGADGGYRKAREMGAAEARKSVRDAEALGITKRSTLWYDLEGFDITNRHCRESALRFLSSWVSNVKRLGYATGVYSSASSGIKMLDDARIKQTPGIVLPGYIWIARWDGVANTSTSHISEKGWQPHRRMKQYRGPHDATYGGVTINIDRNFLDVGKGSVAGTEPEHCGGVKIDWWVYPTLRAGERDEPGKVKTLQCLLREKKLYDGRLHGVYNKATINAARAWQRSRGMTPTATWNHRHWMSLLASGNWPLVKYGSAGPGVRRLQRTLNAAGAGELDITGVITGSTVHALRRWQKRVGHPTTGVATNQTWSLLVRGQS